MSSGFPSDWQLYRGVLCEKTEWIPPSARSGLRILSTTFLGERLRISLPDEAVRDPRDSTRFLLRLFDFDRGLWDSGRRSSWAAALVSSGRTDS